MNLMSDDDEIETFLISGWLLMFFLMGGLAMSMTIKQAKQVNDTGEHHP